MPPSLSVLLAGVVFATGGAMVKCCDFPSLQRAGLRALIGAITLFALLPATRRWPSWRTMVLVLPFFGATCLFVVANTMTTAANTTFMQATAPLWVALLAPFLVRERPTRRDLLMMVGIVAGMTLFFLAPNTASSTAPSPRLGNLIALASGLGLGLMLIGMRWLSQTGGHEAAAAVAWGNAFCVPLAFALMPFAGQTLIAGEPGDWVVIVYLGTIQVGCAYILLVRATPHISAVRVSLLLMVDPALTPVFAFAVHGETPHLLAIAGGVLIVASVATGAVVGQRR